MPAGTKPPVTDRFSPDRAILRDGRLYGPECMMLFPLWEGARRVRSIAGKYSGNLIYWNDPLTDIRWQGTSRGQSINWGGALNSSNSSRVSIQPNPDVLQNTTGLTLAAFFRPDQYDSSNSIAHRYFSKASGTQSADHYIMLGGYQNSGQHVCRSRVKIGGTTYTWVSHPNTVSARIVQGEWNLSILTWESGDGPWWHINGNRERGIEGASATGSVSIDPSIAMAIGNQGSGGRQPFSGDMGWVGVWGFPFSEGLCARIWNDPFILFRQRARLVPLFVAVPAVPIIGGITGAAVVSSTVDVIVRPKVPVEADHFPGCVVDSTVTPKQVERTTAAHTGNAFVVSFLNVQTELGGAHACGAEVSSSVEVISPITAAHAISSTVISGERPIRIIQSDHSASGSSSSTITPSVPIAGAVSAGVLVSADLSGRTAIGGNHSAGAVVSSTVRAVRPIFADHDAEGRAFAALTGAVTLTATHTATGSTSSAFVSVADVSGAHTGSGASSSTVVPVVPIAGSVSSGALVSSSITVKAPVDISGDILAGASVSSDVGVPGKVIGTHIAGASVSSTITPIRGLRASHTAAAAVGGFLGRAVILEASHGLTGAAQGELRVFAPIAGAVSAGAVVSDELAVLSFLEALHASSGTCRATISLISEFVPGITDVIVCRSSGARSLEQEGSGKKNLQMR